MMTLTRQKAEGKRPKGCSALLRFCVFCLVGVPQFWPLLAQETPFGNATDDAQAAADLELITALERVVSRAIARAERSVVSIARRKHEPEQANRVDSHPGGFMMGGRDPSTPLDSNFAASEFATGVVIDARGLILTNKHVLGDDPAENEFFVTTADRKVFAAKPSDRKFFRMKVKASDGMSDLAVLEPLREDSVHNGDFQPITFGDASTLHKGQIVIALGNPYGIARDGQASASWGIVSNLARKANTSADEESLKTLHDYGTLIQTDAKLNLGTSGGALLNVRGEMVGLTTSLAATSGFEQPAGFAIPIDKPMLRIIQALREGREVEYGLLGIMLENRLREEMKRGLPGVLVSGVVAGGPAAKANLHPNDIITRVDGQTIYDKDGLRLHISKLPPGGSVNITVERPADSRPMERRVVLRKLRVELPQTYTRRPAAWRGASIDWRMPRKLPPGHFAIAAPHEDFLTPCVSVSGVEEGSLAWRAGLREGQLVSHVGSTSVGTPEEFNKAVAPQSGPVKLRLHAPDDGSQQTIVVPAE